MRDYGKVYSTFWSSTTTHALSDDGKLLALYLMTCSHNTIAGVFRLPDGYVSEDIGWPAERVSSAFAELFAKGFANRCATTKWVWIVKHLEWNKPENPNQRKSAAKIAQSVPAECTWKLDFIAECSDELGLPKPQEANPSRTVEEPFLNQEQEQEQEQEKPTASSADKLPPCQPQAVIDLYHEALPELPGVRLMNDKRRKAIGAFWRWVLTSKKPDSTRRAQTADQALTWIRSYFDRARENDFLMGRTQRNGEHAAWQCDLDFLMTDRGMKHVIEKTKEHA